MRWALVGLALAAGCGRLGFDAASTGDGGDSDGPRLITYRDVVIEDRPLAYWRLGAAPHHDEMGQFDATFMGTCSAISGPLKDDADTALHFDGTCYALISTGLEFPGNAPFSIEMWIRDERTDLYQIYFMKETRQTGSPVDGYALLINDTNGVYLERYVNTSGPSSDVTPIVANQWVHIVTTYDGAGISIFIDGVQIGTANPAPELMPAVPSAAAIGAINDGFTKLRGDMDELAIYDHALSPAQITKHYDIGVNGPVVSND